MSRCFRLARQFKTNANQTNPIAHEMISWSFSGWIVKNRNKVSLMARINALYCQRDWHRVSRIRKVNSPCRLLGRHHAGGMVTSCSFSLCHTFVLFDARDKQSYRNRHIFAKNRHPFHAPFLAATKSRPSGLFPPTRWHGERGGKSGQSHARFKGFNYCHLLRGGRRVCRAAETRNQHSSLGASPLLGLESLWKARFSLAADDA